MFHSGWSLATVCWSGSQVLLSDASQWPPLMGLCLGVSAFMCLAKTKIFSHADPGMQSETGGASPGSAADG